MIVLSYYAKGDFASKGTGYVIFGPGDTQNLFLSPLLCEKLSVDPNTLYSSDFKQSYLYVLDKVPTLTGRANITFQDEFSIFDKIQQRNFHFYPNSVIAFDVCVDNNTYSGFGSFFLVRGQQMYEEWVKSGESYPPPFIDALQVRDYCSLGKQTYIYNITAEDQYYLLFINDKHTNSYPSTMVVNYDIQRSIYEFDRGSIKTSCSFTTSPCSVHVPLVQSASAVLFYGTPIKWKDSWTNKQIAVNCAPRIWLYVLMSITGVLIITACTLCLCILCCCCSFLLPGKDDESTKPLLGHHTADLYGEKSTSAEMTDPSRDDYPHSKSSPQVQVSFRQPSSSPHPPPSFKSNSSKFSLGSPTFETFANKD